MSPFSSVPKLILLRNSWNNQFIASLLEKRYVLVPDTIYSKIYIERLLKNNQNVVFCKRVECIHEYIGFECRYILKLR